MNATTTSQRECGSCRACCYVCPVAELDKPLMSHCEHECDSGCGIYPERPSGCRVYQCSWLLGEFDDDQRPDQTGVLFEHTSMGFDDGESTVTILLGMTFGNPTDPRSFLRAARPGVVVAIADSSGMHPEHNLIAGTPADCRKWLDFISRAQANGYTRRDHAEDKAGIRINQEPQR